MVLRSQITTGFFQPFYLQTYSSNRCYASVANFPKLDLEFRKKIYSLTADHPQHFVPNMPARLHAADIGLPRTQLNVNPNRPIIEC